MRRLEGGDVPRPGFSDPPTPPLPMWHGEGLGLPAVDRPASLERGGQPRALSFSVHPVLFFFFLVLERFIVVVTFEHSCSLS